jgi:hypothetical protein
MLQITPVAALAEITRTLSDTNREADREDYWNHLKEMALPLGVPILIGALASDSGHPVVIANLAAIQLWQNALMAWCERTIADNGVEETAEGLGFHSEGFTWDADSLADAMFESYEMFLFGQPTN